MHPICLGLYFRYLLIKMKTNFIITRSRVFNNNNNNNNNNEICIILSFIGEILSKICRGVLEKFRIL